MIRCAFVASLQLVSLPLLACGFANGERVAPGDDLMLHYRIKSPPLTVAQHFSMQFLLCRDATTLAIEDFKLDASMPVHGHGMNYKASINWLDNGLVEASGMLFHMPGQWRVTVNLSYDGVARQTQLDFEI
ncbi:MAG: hypothetical protein WBO58_21015 [Gammaproteobacteria bacterium]